MENDRLKSAGSWMATFIWWMVDNGRPPCC